MRDWMRTLRRASFRGVPFWVEIDENDGGRRVVVHEISGGETILTEDMGRRAKGIFVAAYVVGDLSDGAGRALEAACDAPGPSRLALPMDPARTMHCLSCRRSRHKERMGYIAYDLEFVEAGNGATPTAGGLNALRNVFDAGFATAAAALSGIL